MFNKHLPKRREKTPFVIKRSIKQIRAVVDLFTTSELGLCCDVTSPREVTLGAIGNPEFLQSLMDVGVSVADCTCRNQFIGVRMGIRTSVLQETLK